MQAAGQNERPWTCEAEAVDAAGENARVPTLPPLHSMATPRNRSLAPDSTPGLPLDLISDLASIRTLAGLFAWRVAQTPQAPAYMRHDAATNRWIDVSWEATTQRVARYAGALSRLNLARGSRIAILLPNSLDAVCVDQAALS